MQREGISTAGNGQQWVYGSINTNTGGDFSKLLQAPTVLGDYTLVMTATDQTFTGQREFERSRHRRHDMGEGKHPDSSFFCNIGDLFGADMIILDIRENLRPVEVTCFA